ncbi:hypothetical protein D3C87_1846290 [compost metagenome]
MTTHHRRRIVYVVVRRWNHDQWMRQQFICMVVKHLLRQLVAEATRHRVRPEFQLGVITGPEAQIIHAGERMCEYLCLLTHVIDLPI